MNMCEAGDGKWIAMGLIRPHQWEQLISILAWPGWSTIRASNTRGPRRTL
jgi:hypothetical protein